MRSRRCRKVERCARHSKRIQTTGFASHFQMADAGCRPIRLSTFSNLSLRLPAEQDSGFQLFIKSFATMVVQSTCAAAWDKELRSPSNYHLRLRMVTSLRTNTLTNESLPIANLRLPISRNGFALLEEIFSRKGAKEALRNAAALCAFAREIF